MRRTDIRSVSMRGARPGERSIIYIFISFPATSATYRIHAAAKSMGADGSRLARDHARLAERLPTREGRSNALLLGAEFAYEALDLPRARRYAAAGLRSHPRHALSLRWSSLLAKSLLPKRLVAPLRGRRRS